jgi:hypothetical protein
LFRIILTLRGLHLSGDLAAVDESLPTRSGGFRFPGRQPAAISASYSLIGEEA